MRGTKYRSNFFTNLITESRLLKSVFDKQKKDYIVDRKNDLAYNTIRNGFSDKSNQEEEEVTFINNFEKEIKEIYSEYKDAESLSQVTTGSFNSFTYDVFYTKAATKSKKKQTMKTMADMFYDSNDYMEPFDIEIIDYKEGLEKSFWVSSRFDGKEIDKVLQISTNLANAINLSQNYNIIIQGEIGVGKTTLLTKIMKNVMKKSIHKHFATYKIDFEKFASNIIDTNDNFNLKYIEEIIQNKIDDKNELKNKQNIMLFIDNLDIVYQRFCERYFIYNNHMKFKKVLLLLLQALKNIKFDNKTHFATFIALREESVKVLKNQEQPIGNLNQNDSIRDIDMLISINNITDDKINRIVTKRLNLLKDTLEKTDIPKEILTAIKENVKDFSKTKIDFKELANISTEGLRHSMHLFSKISLSVLSKNYFERFMIDGYYIKKLHLLGEDLLYSQVNKGIVNIFLNNAKYRQYWCNNTEQAYPGQLLELAKLPHMHTYWLKYFILSYLYHYKDKQYISLDELLSVFSPENEDQAYEESVVRLVLLGLAEVEHGRLIDIKLSQQENIEGFRLSSRANYILDEIIWSFDYLAVIVEDKWLELPDIIGKIDNFDKNINGYCLIRDNETFKEQQRQIFSMQIKKVFIFLKVLELSFYKEIEKVKYTYDKLDIKAIDYKNNIKFGIPIFPTIREKIKTDIEIRAEKIGCVEAKKILSSDYGITGTVKKELESLLLDKYFLNNKDYLVTEEYFKNIKMKVRDIVT